MNKKLDKRSKEYKELMKSQSEATQIVTPTIENVIEEELPTIEISNEELIKNNRLINAILKNVPEGILSEMLKILKCDCIIGGYELFYTPKFSISVELQNEFIKYFKDNFNEHIGKSSCTSCIMRRLVKIREHIKSKVDADLKKNPFD